MLSHDFLDLLVLNQGRRSLSAATGLGADAPLKINGQWYNKGIFY